MSTRDLPAEDRPSSPEAARPVRVHMYHHTHWDREWWSTVQRFRFRLVHTVDRILQAVEEDPRLTSFVLDGQTLVLRDYLEVRPRERERLTRLINEGRLHVGPWHILPDEFLVSGEATVRNLWLGERSAREYGVRKSTAGYLPDQFGHVAQMPQILAGFGIDNAIVWRGFGAPPVGHDEGGGDVGKDYYLFPQARNRASFPERTQNEFWWEAPDGTRVLGVYLPLEYYRSHYKVIPDDPEATFDHTVGRSRRTVNYLRAYAATDVILEPMGGDHLPVDPRLPDLLDEINTHVAQDGFQYVLSSLDGFLRDVRAQRERVSVVWRGEGRAFGRKAHLLPGVLSARLYLKRMNFDAQTALERYAEPLQALAWLRGERYEQDYLWYAWDRLVQNHPHDSICGCSIDQVHREMLPRFAEAQQAADVLAEDALAALACRVDPSFAAPGGLVLTVFNPLNWTRTETAVVRVNGFLEVNPETWMLVDATGQEVPFQARTVTSDLEKSEPFSWLDVAGHGHHTNDEFTDVVFQARDVSGLGYRAFALRRRETRVSQHRVRPYGIAGNVALHKGDVSPTDLRVGVGTLENAHLRVTVNPEDGTVRLLDKRTGHTYDGLNSFEDGGDNGDTYNYAWPVGDQAFSTDRVKPRLSFVEFGPGSATLRVSWPMTLPAGLTPDRQSRSPEHVEFLLHSDLTLHAGVARVDVRTHFTNTARDHRLRARFPLGARVTHSSAESPFCVVDRPTALPDGERGSAEPAVHEHPQESFVSVSAEGRGLTIANKGLPEFSVSEDGTVFLTVLRAVGWLSREDFLTRVGGAGPTCATPDAQMLHEVVAEYSLIPHAGTWQEAGAAREAHAFRAPLLSATQVPQIIPLRNATRPVTGGLPPEGQLLRVDGDVILSALKRAEDRDALIVRVVNLSGEPREVSLALPGGFAAAHRVNLLEQPQEDLAHDGSSVRVTARPWEILTVSLEVDAR